MEVHFYVDLHRHRLSIFHGRLELPILDRLDSFFIQAETKTSRNFDVTWASIRAYDKPQNADTLIFRFARFLGIFRFGIRKDPWRAHTAAYAEDAATNSPAFTRSDARAFSGTYAAART